MMSEVDQNVSYTQNPALIAGNTVESMAPQSVNFSAKTGLPSAEDMDRVAEELQLIANAQKAFATRNTVETALQDVGTTGPLAAEVRALRAELDEIKARIEHFNSRSGQKI
jgi:hypothetical protein